MLWCKKEVSSRATACPNCGCPVEVEIKYWTNGRMKRLAYFKDGKLDGLQTAWHKDGKHHGLWAHWYDNGRKKRETNHKDGKPMSAADWNPDGEKCPVTNVKDGNGILVWYNEDGTELIRNTYKDGELVKD
jgi:antitoxin component YwqK of YwqJK toxin-antitoxin module